MALSEKRSFVISSMTASASRLSRSLRWLARHLAVIPERLKTSQLVDQESMIRPEGKGGVDGERQSGHVPGVEAGGEHRERREKTVRAHGNASTFVCWKGGEDITDLVKPLIDNAERNQRLDARLWTTCTQGDVNIFQLPLGAPRDRTIPRRPVVDLKSPDLRQIFRGEPPADDDKTWINASSRLQPTQSLDRIDQFGKYLFSLSSVLGLVLTGYGILGAKPTSVRPWQVIPPLLACAALACAMWALRLHIGKVEVSDIDALIEHFDNLIERRAVWIARAGLLFTACIASSPLMLYTGMGSSSRNATVSLRFDNSLGKEVVAAKIELEGVPPDAVQRGWISADQTTGVSAVLAREVTQASGSGRLSIELSTSAAAYRSFTLTSQVDRRGKLIRQDTMTIGK
jgi:hypothetical protein